MSSSIANARKIAIYTWCKFWYDKQHSTNNYSEVNRLPAVFRKELNPLIERLSQDDLLKRCLKGLTQNQNESLNGSLWSRCPKTKFCGKRKVELAVAETVCCFNTGASGKVTILEALGVNPGTNMLSFMRSEDNERLNHAERKSSMKSRMERRKRRKERKTKNDDCAKVNYLTGGFGLSIEPDPEIDEPVKKKQKLSNKIKSKESSLEKSTCVPSLSPNRKKDQIKVTFVDEKDLIMNIQVHNLYIV